MRRPKVIILTILTATSLLAIGQIKSHYRPFEYSADKIKKMKISKYQLDSIKYEVLFYRDLLEETKRTFFISQKTKYIDTINSNRDSLVIRYFGANGSLLLKKVIEYPDPSKQRVIFLDETYFLDSSKISYRSRSIFPDSSLIDSSNNREENVIYDTILQIRSRYVYDLSGLLDRVIVDSRIGGASTSVTEYKNDKRTEQDFHRFQRKKRTVWEFWD